LDLKNINSTLDLLYNSIKDGSKHNHSSSLSAGSLSISLFYFKYGKYLKNASILDLSYIEFEKAYALIETSNIDETTVNIIDGFGGVAWLFQYFINNNFIEYDNDFLSYFDDLIIKRCYEEIKNTNYDLFYGIIGCGSYFLQRVKYNPQCVSYLNEIVGLLNKEKDENNIIWNDRFSKSSGYINFGLAHGLPSQIIFFSKVYKLTGNVLSKELANSAIDFILKYKSTDKMSISLFPNFVSYYNNDINYNSRLAWCYGDIGIGYSILYYSVVINSQKHRKIAIDILKKCASIKQEDLTSGIKDKCFCHGTSGIFHIFNNIVNKFGLNEFYEVKNYWLNKTLENYSDINSFMSCAFDKKAKKEIYINDIGLIEGYIGIGLTLLANVDSTANEWEELFML